MDDTDRLIAAFFAAAMSVKQTEPNLTDFFAHYDACVSGIEARERAAMQAKQNQTEEAHSRLWEEAPIRKIL